MNQKNTKKLLKDFPNLYKQYYWDKTQTCLCWGFDVLDGWYDLIYKLSEDLMKVSPECECSQCKEKFGFLRYYVDNCNEEGHKLIDEAEKKSGTICEICGKPGKSREDLGWIKTLCLEHYDVFRDPLKYRDYRRSKGK
jgi:hypothetical protein